MVQRLTHRTHHNYATKSNQHRVVKTLGGKLLYQRTKKRASGPKFGFWDVRGCGVVSGWFKGDVDSKAAVNGVGPRREEGTPALVKHHHQPPVEP
ncbi:hypothetical protein CUMW_062910 [Citrus unshiu]|nr:hypothetical protein CUMW_062910 [Citrus unshiu]